MGTTNTLDLNNRVNALEKAVSGGDSAQANKSDIATEFSVTTNYTAGCFVYYGGKLYQFNADHSAGAWDPTDAVEANVTDQVVSNAAAIAGLTASDVAYDNTASGLTATDVQGAVDELRQADNIMMSDGVTSVEDAVDEVMQIGDATSIIETGAVSIANGTVTSVASKKLPAGLYLLNFVYNWANNSSGIREILYSTNATAPSPAPSRLLCASAAAHSDAMFQNASLVIRLTSEQTVYFWAYQNSGSAVTLWPFIEAVLLKAY